jgi:hypothetical protein
MKRFWIINLALFQACWICAAFFTTHANWVMPIAILLNFALSPTRSKDLRLLALVPLGLMVDKILLDLGIFNAGEGFFPTWLALLWIMFIISLNHSLRWLDNRSILTLVLLGAIGGTSSYWGGVESGAIEALQTNRDTVVILMLNWALLLPTLVIFKRRLYQTQPMLSWG